MLTVQVETLQSDLQKMLRILQWCQSIISKSVICFYIFPPFLICISPRTHLVPRSASRPHGALRLSPDAPHALLNSYGRLPVFRIASPPGFSSEMYFKCRCLGLCNICRQQCIRADAEYTAVHKADACPVRGSLLNFRISFFGNNAPDFFKSHFH